MIAKSFTERQFLRRYIWLSILALITAFCAFQTSEAQINSDCVTTAIWVEGYGWVAGSEQTTCTGTNTPDNDGFIGDGGDSPCGPGGCPEAPEDTDEGLSEQQKCQIEQAKESNIDQLAQDIANEIRTRSDWRRREYGAVIYYSTARGYRRDGLDRGTSNDIDLTISRRNDEMIVALVHSHPRNGGDAPSNEDWDIADLLFDTNRAKESSFSHYILSGDDKKIYEFDTSDRSRRSGRRSDHDDANGVCNV